jgi:hypothetical protein
MYPINNYHNFVFFLNFNNKWLLKFEFCRSENVKLCYFSYDLIAHKFHLIIINGVLKFPLRKSNRGVILNFLIRFGTIRTLITINADLLKNYFF